MAKVGVLFAIALVGCHRAAVSAPDPDPAVIPEALDGAMIASTVRKSHGRIRHCASITSATGEVLIEAVVGPDGVVTQSRLLTSPSAILGTCISAVVDEMRFPRTRAGGSFSYPFIILR